MYNIIRNGKIFNAEPITDFNDAVLLGAAMEAAELKAGTEAEWRVQQIDYTAYVVTFGKETPLTSAISETSVEKAEAYIESAADGMETMGGIARDPENFHIWAVTSTKSYARVS